MKTNYIKQLLLVTLFIGFSTKINAQNELKSSIHGDEIIQHLKLDKFGLTNLDIQNLFIDSEYLSKKNTDNSCLCWSTT